MTKETRKLRCHLSEDEVANRADQLAAAVLELELEKENQAEAKAAMRDKLKAMQKAREALARAVSERAEERDVEVDKVYRHARLQVDYVRVDTGAVVETRAMTDDERQMRLPVSGAVRSVTDMGFGEEVDLAPGETKPDPDRKH